MLVAAFSFAGCESDSPVATAETIAEDSALAAQVLSAEGDNLFAVGAETDDSIDEPEATDVVAQQPSPSPAPAPQRALAVAPVAPKQPAATVAVANATSRVVSTPRIQRTRRPAVTRGPAGVVSSGASLTLVANRRVCADAGETFRATVVDAVRGSNGVMIPRGAQATAEVTGSDKWGAGISVRVNSVRISGRTYPVASRAGYVLPDRSGCIRERGRIEVETIRPLRVVALTTR
ncbi:MAG TPA: hypothetical protein VGC52_03650 [Gemmatimonadaceae bacterium]